MARALLIVMIVFAVIYALALIVLLVGTFGLFGAERDPLSGVFLIPLGLPWNRFVDIFPERLWPWLAAASPLVNLAILWILRLLALNRTGGVP
jgi:hypothetical protein